MLKFVSKRVVRPSYSCTCHLFDSVQLFNNPKILQTPKFMRITFTLVAMILFAMAGLSQEATYGSVTITTTNAVTKEVNKRVIPVDEVTQFNLSAYITEHAAKGKVTAYGTYLIEGEQTTVAFNSQQIQDAGGLDTYCKVVEYGLKPILGVGVESTKTLAGVLVKRIVSNSAAESLGIEIGDVILTVNNEEVNSWCDLRRVVSQTEVGQIVPVQFRKDGLVLSKTTVIGGKTIERLTFGPCIEESIESAPYTANGVTTASEIEMSVYPNPTQRVANIRYTSDEDAPVTFFVIAMDGSILFHEEYQVVNGDVFINYNFQAGHSGAYQFVIQQEDKVYVEQVQVID